MPNHTHGIIIINKTDDYKNDKSIKGSDVGRKVQTTKLVVSTPQAPRTAAASQKWKPATLGAIINQYKRICTIESRKINPNFTWQPRYYDHIIRDYPSHQRIRNYIINNPINWHKDALNTKKKKIPLDNSKLS